MTFAAVLREQRQWAARELDLNLAAELSVADRAPVDRPAVSSTLQELGYLTLQPNGRAERPKRLSRESLARRVAEFRGESPAFDCDVGIVFHAALFDGSKTSRDADESPQLARVGVGGEGNFVFAASTWRTPASCV